MRASLFLLKMNYHLLIENRFQEYCYKKLTSLLLTNPDGLLKKTRLQVIYIYKIYN